MGTDVPFSLSDIESGCSFVLGLQNAIEMPSVTNPGAQRECCRGGRRNEQHSTSFREMPRAKLALISVEWLRHSSSQAAIKAHD